MGSYYEKKKCIDFEVLVEENYSPPEELLEIFNKSSLNSYNRKLSSDSSEIIK